MYVYKLMTTPGLGLPLTWNQNDPGTPLPPILACRSDGQPFSRHEWRCLCEFDEYLQEIAAPEEQRYHTNRAEFKTWVALWVERAAVSRPPDAQSQPDAGDPACAFPDVAPCFGVRFPLGLQVRASGLASRPELNGRTCTVVDYDEPKLRVGVDFGGGVGRLSLKHTSLALGADGWVRRRAMLLEAAQPSAGRRESGTSMSASRALGRRRE